MTPDERIDAILQLAIDQYHKDGEIELTDNDSADDISEGDDNGAYVRAWVWVDFEGTDLDKTTDDCDCGQATCLHAALEGDE